MGLTPSLPVAKATPGEAGYPAWADQFPNAMLGGPRTGSDPSPGGALRTALNSVVAAVPEPSAAGPESTSQEVVPMAPDQTPPRFGVFPYAELVEPAQTFVRVDSPIEVTFNRPMARLTVERGFRIKPEVPGQFRWIDDKTVRYEPTRLAYQTRYQIELSGVAESGEPLRGLTTWSFTTLKPITLTIDDCGTEAQLRTILAVLAERHVKAMMFANGWCVARYPWLVNAMLAGGHQVCNHTYSHPHLTSLSDAQIIAEVKTGKLANNCDWFKAPFDDTDARVERLVRQQGFRPLHYDIDTLDWQGLSVEAMLDRINQGGGGMISCHFWGPNTIELLRRLPLN